MNTQPPLPEPRMPDENGAGWFTAGQMHAYGKACATAAVAAALAPVTRPTRAQGSMDKWPFQEQHGRGA